MIFHCPDRQNQIKLLTKQSRPMKCFLVRVGGYRGGGGLVPINLSATPVGVVGAFFNRDVDRKNCPSLLRPVRGDAFIGAVWKVNVSLYRSSRVAAALRRGIWIGSHLLEANVGALLTEALTADVEAVLADQTGAMGADAAVKINRMLACVLFPVKCPPPYPSSCLLGLDPTATRIFPSTWGRCVRTKSGHPCRSHEGGSSRRIRETYCRLTI